MSNRKTGPVAVKTESTAWGEMVAIRSRKLFLNVAEAEELARQLIVAANRVRELSARPQTRPLPFSEGLTLLACGDTHDGDAGRITPAGVIVSAGGAS